MPNKNNRVSSSHTGPTRPIVFTGQVGLSKRGFIQKVADEVAVLTGRKVQIESTGDRMYREDPSIPDGEILKFSPRYLRALRRAVMRDILQVAKDNAATGGITFLNTHASFRWSLGPVPGQDLDHFQMLDPQMIVNVLDNVHTVHARLRNHPSLPHSITEAMIARELEQHESGTLTRFIQHCHNGRMNPLDACRLFIAARGPNDRRAHSVAQMIVNPHQTKVYPSFPMTLVQDLPDVLKRIDAFRDRLAEHFIVSDPADVDEKGLTYYASLARKARKRMFAYKIDGIDVLFDTAEVLAVEPLIDRQICERDFLLIDQSDMIVSLIPELPDGKASISSGVERELHHAYITGKKVYVVWLPKKRQPSPFITNHAHLVTRHEDELLAQFAKMGLIRNGAKALKPGSPRRRAA